MKKHVFIIVSVSLLLFSCVTPTFAQAKMSLDGVSAHCPIWVHTTAWTGSPTIRPFIPADVAKKSPAEIEKWAEDYILRLLDLCAELGVRIVPMFWGVAFGWEMATGYPWGFFAGPGYDLEETVRAYAARVPAEHPHQQHPHRDVRLRCGLPLDRDALGLRARRDPLRVLRGGVFSFVAVLA